MVGMVTQFGRGRYVDIIAGRTGQSGGSIGGVKKAGTVQYGTTWMSGNMSNFLRRVDRGCCNKTPLFLLTRTTRNPLQYNRNGYSVMHSGTLG